LASSQFKVFSAINKNRHNVQITDDMWHIVERELTIMANKITWLAVQIAICISLLWITKEISGKLSLAYLAIAYILSFVLTKALEHWVKQRKAREIG
jgi:4-hydroxybenzoate polyprenyltransferase